MKLKQKTFFKIEKNILKSWVVRSFFFLLTSGGVAIFFYGHSLNALFTAVLQRTDSSHGILIPFFSIYLLWRKIDTIKGLKPESSLLPGSALLFAGLLLFYLVNTSRFSLLLSVLSFLSIVGALIVLFFGRSVFRVTAFPLFFLLTMIPLPPNIYNQIALWLRHVNTFTAVMVTKALGVPLYREEFTIHLPEINLLVSDGCSGIRYLLSYFTFSIIYAFLFKQSIVARLLVISGSIPLAVLGGISRLSLIFLAAHYISPIMAEHRPHVILSWGVFVFWFIMAVGIDQYWSRDRLRKNKNLPHFTPHTET